MRSEFCGKMERYPLPAALEKAKQLQARAKKEGANGHIIYPPQDQIFRALTLTPPEAVKVVIIGQDPYHGPGQANGLAFSVAPGVAIPPSLRNIFKELQDDLGCPPPKSGDLTPWAERGVLLLNTSLTVEQGKPASHGSLGLATVCFRYLSGLRGSTPANRLSAVGRARPVPSLPACRYIPARRINAACAAVIQALWEQPRPAAELQLSWAAGHFPRLIGF